MPWYAAKIVLECRVHDQRGLCDEQIRVIDASDPEAAYEAAVALGREEEHQYANTEEQQVSWIFCGLSDLVELSLEKIDSGAEVWSTLFEGTPAHQLVAPKERLTAIAMVAKASESAKSLLGQRMRPYAPK